MIDPDKPQLVYFGNAADEEGALDYIVSHLFREHEDAKVLDEVQRIEEEEEAENFMPKTIDWDSNKDRRYRDTDSVSEFWHLKFPWSATNRAVAKATAGQRTFHQWRRNMLVAAMTSRGDHSGGSQVYKDIDLRDSRDAVDFLADYGNPQRRQDKLAAILRWSQRFKAKEREVGDGGIYNDVSDEACNDYIRSIE